MRFAREHNERMTLAWHIEALHRTKRLPKLKTLLARTTSGRRQTWQEQLKIMDQWVSHTARVEQKRAKAGKQRR